MFKFAAAPLSVASALLTIGALAGAAPVPTPTPTPSSATTGWTIVVNGTNVYTPAQVRASNAADEKEAVSAAQHTVQPNYNPVIIADCNVGITDQEVGRYNSTNDGLVKMLCGSDNGKGSGSGYVHIRAGHESQWQGYVDEYPAFGNWDDLMEFSTKSSIEKPASGFPTYRAANNTNCYSAAIGFRNPQGVTVKTINPTISVSRNNKIVITSFPTSKAPTTC